MAKKTLNTHTHCSQAHINQDVILCQSGQVFQLWVSILIQQRAHYLFGQTRGVRSRLQKEWIELEATQKSGRTFIASWAYPPITLVGGSWVCPTYLYSSLLSTFWSSCLDWRRNRQYLQHHKCPSSTRWYKVYKYIAVLTYLFRLKTIFSMQKVVTSRHNYDICSCTMLNVSNLFQFWVGAHENLLDHMICEPCVGIGILDRFRHSHMCNPACHVEVETVNS